MSYEQTEAKLRALAAQREAERFRSCLTPGCRLEEGHAGLHRFVPEVERLRARVAELEAHPPAASDLRERLLESALRGVSLSGYDKRGSESLGRAAVWMAFSLPLPLGPIRNTYRLG